MSLIANNLARHAMTFALGLIIGIGLFWALAANDRLGGGLDIDDLAGSMGSVASSEGFEEIGSVGFNLENVYGDFSLHGSQRKLVAEISLSSLQEIEWALKYDRDDVAFDGFSQIEGQMGDMETRSGELKVSQIGKGHYVVFFMGQVDDPKPLRIEVSMDGKVIYKNDLTEKPGH